MLKSTHKSALEQLPLPPGWTEHKAPSGHSYYYDAATKTSTYTRPITSQKAAPQTVPQASAQASSPYGGFEPQTQGLTLEVDNRLKAPDPEQVRHGLPPQFHAIPRQPHLNRKPEPTDRPKSKHPIPGCAPWVLVKTKLGRRFVFNPDLGGKFWKFPPDVMKCVVELDRKEREKRERRERGEASTDGEDSAMKNAESTVATPSQAGAGGAEPEYDSDEYEEVEVTDEEDVSSKRQKVEDEKPEGPVEFNEDDIAYQLAAMGQEAGGYDDEQAEGDWYEDYEDAPLDEADSEALFIDMLEDFHINPFTPWESIIEEGKIIDDERYTCLPNMKARKDVWGRWSTEKIQKVKDAKAHQEKKDPRVPYLAFLQQNAAPNLYWVEFKRKYKKEPEMRDTKLSDKDREKWYREYINRLKLSENTLKSELSALLKSQPLELLNRNTRLEALPIPILTDMRYVSLRPQVRDPLVEAYIAIQPHAPEKSNLSAEEAAKVVKQKEERERREKALAERERRVQEEKKRRDIALRHSKGMLRDGEEDIERAMKVGREGLLGHFKDDVRAPKVG